MKMMALKIRHHLHGPICDKRCGYFAAEVSLLGA
jgi:hypothetical protein